MTTYRFPDGTDVLVCDGCGLDAYGEKPDLAGAEPLDLTAAMLLYGFPPGTKVDAKDWCPKCDPPKNGRGRRA